MPREILAVKKEKLFPHGPFQGFIPLKYHDFHTTILNNYEYVVRDHVEEDPSIIQIIPYIWLINPQTKKAFIYRRSFDVKEYDDKRYVGKYSGGVGGHIDKDTESSQTNPIETAMIRELQEEVAMREYPTPYFVGYIKDDSDMFNRVHMGCVAIAETTQDVSCAEGVTDGAFYSVEEVDKLFADPTYDVEVWTRVSWPFIKNYILSKQ